ncbi:MAG: potassium channel family protein [Rhodobacterales bacterium]
MKDGTLCNISTIANFKDLSGREDLSAASKRPCERLPARTNSTRMNSRVKVSADIDDRLPSQNGDPPRHLTATLSICFAYLARNRMHIFLISLAAMLLVATTVLIHYETLRFTGQLLPRLPIRPRQRVLVVIAACFIGHLLEIILYALAFALLNELEGFGWIDGEFEATALDYFYFSITSYTTLGVGDVYPRGALRVLAGVEALNGFLLITWSASFTYLMMQRYWHPERDK